MLRSIGRPCAVFVALFGVLLGIASACDPGLDGFTGGRDESTSGADAGNGPGDGAADGGATDPIEAGDDASDPGSSCRDAGRSCDKGGDCCSGACGQGGSCVTACGGSGATCTYANLGAGSGAGCCVGLYCSAGAANTCVSCRSNGQFPELVDGGANAKSCCSGHIDSNTTKCSGGD